jgi:hypothetical protein
MPLAFRAIRASYGQIGRYVGLMIVANIGATVLVLPILAIAIAAALLLHAQAGIAVGVAVIVGILPSPSNAGIQFVTHEAADVTTVFWRDQLDGLRRYGLQALKVWVVALAMTILLAGNAVFYARLGFPGSRVVAAVWLLALLFWLMIHLYVYPLLMRQEVHGILLLYRNAALMTLARPIFTISLTLVWWLVLFATTLTGFVGVIGLVVCASIQQNATATILPTFQQAPSERHSV